MTYQEAVNWLYSRLPAWHRVGKAAYKANLDNTLALDTYFGHPHRSFRTIHVAGTNGKGSVSHMLASVLMEAGFKTGLYTSPHLKDFRERIRINGMMIPEDEVSGFISKHERFINELQPSFFELTVAMAFDHFARMGVDIAVIEVGMGGRLDSTNIINPELSVITNIGHDHMEFLGETLAAIAGEKAGIIKSSVPVVIGETQEETMEVFRSVAEERGSELLVADRMFSCHLGKFDPETGTRPYLLTGIDGGKSLTGITPLGGLAQEKNLCTVAAACSLLSQKNGISIRHITDGIARVVSNTGLAGRWQVLSTRPLTVCDTGHNLEGLRYVIRQIASVPKRRLHMVIGFVNDKDLSAVLPLMPTDAVYYFTRASLERALDETLLMEQAGKYCLTGTAYHTVAEALRAATKSATEEDMIFVGGSTFVVAEVV